MRGGGSTNRGPWSSWGHCELYREATNRSRWGGWGPDRAGSMVLRKVQDQCTEAGGDSPCGYNGFRAPTVYTSTTQACPYEARFCLGSRGMPWRDLLTIFGNNGRRPNSPKSAQGQSLPLLPPIRGHAVCTQITSGEVANGGRTSQPPIARRKLPRTTRRTAHDQDRQPSLVRYLPP